MSASKIKAGDAFVELTIRDKLTQGLNRASGRLRAFAATVGTIGAAISGLGFAALTPLLMAAKSFADVGSELHDMAGRTGLAADNLSELKYAAEQSGTSLEEVEKAIRHMQKIGISADKFDDVAAAIAAITDPTKRAQAAMAVWGKAGTNLLPMIQELAALREQARKLGAVLTPAQAAAADELGDAFGRLHTALLGIRMQVGAAIAPALTKILDLMTVAAVAVSNFARANPMLTATLFGLAAGLVIVGGALLGLAAALAAIGAILPAAATGLAFLASPFGMLVAGITAATVAIVALGVAFRKEIASMLTSALAMAETLAVAMGGDFARGLIIAIKTAIALLEAEINKSRWPGGKKRGPDFDLGEAKDLFGGSRGQFGGHRAESLAIGSGGGIGDKLDKSNKLLAEIKAAIGDTTKAVEEIEGEEFE